MRQPPPPWVFIAAFFAAAVNLRAPFVAVAPITARLRDDLGVGAGAVGLVTSIPLLCFGFAAPFGLAVIRRLGADAAMVTTLAAVAAGAAIRSAGPYGMVLAGSVVIGMAITIGNIVAPVLIRREVPASRVGLMTGVYTCVLNIGSVLATVLTEPIAQALGWRIALAAWGVLALAGLGVWWLLMYVLHGSRAATPPATGAPAHSAPREPLWRNRMAWVLALAFAGQATSYYTLTAWLPSILGDEAGLDRSAAGALSAIFQGMALVGALAVPLLAFRLPPWLPIGLVGICWVAFPVQLLVDPGAYVLGSVLGGFAQGGGFAALFTAVAQLSRTDGESARLSAFMQGFGYIAAAIGPPVTGHLHDLTGGWTIPVAVTIGTTLMFFGFGLTAGVVADATAGRRQADAYERS